MNKRVLLSTAVAFALLGSTPAIADAQTVTGDTTGLNPSSVTECSTVGATIVVTPDADAKNISGTKFTLERIDGIDLTTQEGWDKAKALTLDEAAKAPKAEKYTATTNEKGEAIFTGLKPGVYYVTAVAPNDGQHLTPERKVITLPVGNKDEAGNAGWDCAPRIVAKFEITETTPPTTPSKPTMPPFTPPTKPSKPTEPTTPGKTTPKTTPSKTPGKMPSTSNKTTTPKTSTPGSKSSSGSSSSGKSGPLAVTGVQALQLVGVAAVLIAFGFILLGGRRRNEKRGK